MLSIRLALAWIFDRHSVHIPAVCFTLFIFVVGLMHVHNKLVDPVLSIKDQ